MKALVTLILVGISLVCNAQTHQLGLGGGINTLLSWNDEPPFGEGSPFDSKIGHTTNLTYTFVFKNGITISLQNSLVTLNYLSDNAIAFRDENNEPVRADRKLSLQNYQASLGGGYVFNFGDRYTMNVHAGLDFLFYFNQVAYSKGYPETKIERKQDWEEDNRFYGVFLGMRQNYDIYKSQNLDLFLTCSLRATQIFDYINLSGGENRLLPELTLGIGVSFGKFRGSRF